MTRASTAVGISPRIKEAVTQAARANRLTLKEVILMGIKAIDLLDAKQRQELADQIHKLQVDGDI
jgi:hypothetical protein